MRRLERRGRAGREILLRDAPLDRLPIGFKPFLIKRERLLLLAGLWSTREGDDGSESPVSCVDFSDRGGALLSGISIADAIEISERGEVAEK